MRINSAPPGSLFASNLSLSHNPLPQLASLSARMLATGLLVLFSNATNAEEFANEQELINNSIEVPRSFGSEIDTSENTALVTSLDDENGQFAGAVSIFTKNTDDQWQWLQKIVASDGRPYQNFGESVSIHNDVIAVGAGGFLTNRENSVYLFEREADGLWQEQQKLTPDNVADGDFFGHAVELGNNVLFVGANGTGDNQGSVYVYNLASNGEWTQFQQLNASDGSAGDRFGEVISIANDNTILIGSSWRNINGESSAGAVYAFTRESDGSWTESQIIAAPEPQHGERFGNVLSADGDTVLIGSERDFSDTDPSSAYVFQFNDSGSWELEQKITQPPGSDSTKFGTSVSLKNDTAIITAPFGASGTAYVYRENDNSIWTERQQLQSGSSSFNQFGISVSYNGDDLFIGDNIANGNGAAYAYSESSIEAADGCTYLNASIQDGWGWNESTGQSCPPLDRVQRATTPDCELSNSDSDGDGYGWENNQTCIAQLVVNPPSDGCMDYGTFPWGWNPSTLTSCRLDTNAEKAAR